MITLGPNQVDIPTWVNVATNHGAPGIDGVSIDSVEAGGTEGVRSFLDSLAAVVKAQRYRPQPLRRVKIPKAGKPGETRPLGIPTLRYRVLMSAAKLVLEAIFEADFSPASFGFRPKRSAHDALEVIRQSANGGAHWVLDADIKSCFDEIDQDALMALIERRVCDRAMLKLLGSWLRAGIIEGGVYSVVSSGTPQGSPISPLLCNIALSVLDEELTKARRQTGKLIRFADDWVVLCPSKERAETAHSLAEAVLVTLGLRLHPDKTRIVHLSGGAEGFDFLGFHNHMCESVKWPGRYLPPEMAVGAGHGLHQGQGQRDDSTAIHRVIARRSGGSAQSRAAGLGWLLPTWKLIEEVRHRQQLRPPTDGDPGQQHARALGTQLGHPVQLWVAPRASGSTG